MRPRLNKTFGIITFKELNKYLVSNMVYGFTVKRNDTDFIYSYHIMFRNNKRRPEVLYIKVSRTSKLVIGAWTNWDKKFDSIYSLKNYIEK